MSRKKVIVGSVAVPPYTNYGNRLIEKSTLELLGLPPDTPHFSVFEKISDELLEWINAHDYLIITGCTTLQDDPGHQRCFDSQFERIKTRVVCFGASFYCDSSARPSLRVARMYGTPIGARDPWTAEFLTKNDIPCSLIGCPTLLDQSPVPDWFDSPGGSVLISSSPELHVDYSEFVRGKTIKYIKHDFSSSGNELDYSLFAGATLVITGRLHAALPAIARGIRTKFYDPQHWNPYLRDYTWGSTRYSLLEYLGINFDGNDQTPYPIRQIQQLKNNFDQWLVQVFGS
jgi:hypothetical protein